MGESESENCLVMHGPDKAGRIRLHVRQNMRKKKKSQVIPFLHLGS